MIATMLKTVSKIEQINRLTVEQVKRMRKLPSLQVSIDGRVQTGEVVYKSEKVIKVWFEYEGRRNYTMLTWEFYVNKLNMSEDLCI